MHGDGAYFSVDYDQVARVAGQLAEVCDALDAAAGGAGDLDAVASDGFTSVDAALDCARAWVAQVRRYAGRVDAARAGLDGGVTAYQDTDAAADGSFGAFGATIGPTIGAEPW